MVGIEQHDVLAVVQSRISHELVDIGLADALLWVVDPGRHPFPFRVDDQHYTVTLTDKDVRLSAEPSCGSIVKAVPVSALCRN